MLGTCDEEFATIDIDEHSQWFDNGPLRNPKLLWQEKQFEHHPRTGLTGDEWRELK